MLPLAFLHQFCFRSLDGYGGFLKQKRKHAQFALNSSLAARFIEKLIITYNRYQIDIKGAAMKFTAHGKHRANERGITEQSILRAVQKPTSSFYDLTSSAYVAFKKLNGQQLLVVYTSEGNEI